MIRTARTMLTLATLALLAACSPLSVNYDYDNTADFSKYKSFAWMAKPSSLPSNPASSPQNSDLLDRRIRASVEAELKARGLNEDAAAPNLLVVYHLGVQDKLQVTDYGYTYSPYYWGGGGRQIDVYQYQEGSLIIDLVDAETKNLVWRGSGSKVIENTQMSPEQMQAKVAEIVGSIMASFPPKGK